MNCVSRENHHDDSDMFLFPVYKCRLLYCFNTRQKGSFRIWFLQCWLPWLPCWGCARSASSTSTLSARAAFRGMRAWGVSIQEAETHPYRRWSMKSLGQNRWRNMKVVCPAAHTTLPALPLFWVKPNWLWVEAWDTVFCFSTFQGRTTRCCYLSCRMSNWKTPLCAFWRNKLQ